MPYTRRYEDLSIGEMECLILIVKFTLSYSVTTDILRDGCCLYLTYGLYFVAITILIVERHYIVPADYLNKNLLTDSFTRYECWHYARFCISDLK
jgi:hypothetical protein